MNPYLIPAMKTLTINKQLSQIRMPEQIISIVTSYFCEHTPMSIRFPNIQPKQLGELVKSSTRKREIIQARFTICYFMKEILDLPLKSIGLILGKRDHSSIIHAISTYSDDVYTSSLNFKRHEDICQLLAVDNRIEQIKRNR